MDDNPNPAVMLNFDGPEGQSLFRRFLVWCFPVEWESTVQKEADAVFSHLSAEDERAVALVAAMVVEDGVNKLVAAYVPGYKDLAAKSDFTFSMRIELAQALRLCPSRLLGAADTLRRIRNEFAHKLTLKTFDGCKAGSLESARSHLRQIQPAMELNKSNREIVTNLASVVYLALRGYSFHVTRLNQYIREEKDFREALHKHCIEKYPQIVATK
ncbi:MAG: hypothetical protein CVU51_00805 [Deltaproteobacteria bacterium HGW-Deltaproteobacteria-1]|jgi:hypothetical protein|nr:MAG: hypothetical protein CVU51_00805 [Deltaproteobacteria bacterium HGW-Deltaproteobacteria-1]